MKVNSFNSNEFSNYDMDEKSGFKINVISPKVELPKNSYGLDKEEPKYNIAKEDIHTDKYNKNSNSNNSYMMNNNQSNNPTYATIDSSNISEKYKKFMPESLKDNNRSPYHFQTNKNSNFENKSPYTSSNNNLESNNSFNNTGDSKDKTEKRKFMDYSTNFDKQPKLKGDTTPNIDHLDTVTNKNRYTSEKRSYRSNFIKPEYSSSNCK